MILKRIGILSLGKVAGLLYGAMGLALGLILSPISILGGSLGALENGPEGAILALIFGVGAIFFLPAVYGVMGFVTGILCAAFYNLVARFFGGLELEMEGTGPPGTGT